MGPAAVIVLGQFDTALRFFRQEPCDHTHGKFDGHFAPAALFKLIPQPAIDFFIARSEPYGDFLEHLHQRFGGHRVLQSNEALGRTRACGWFKAFLVRFFPTPIIPQWCGCEVALEPQWAGFSLLARAQRERGHLRS